MGATGSSRSLARACGLVAECRDHPDPNVRRGETCHLFIRSTECPAPPTTGSCCAQSAFAAGELPLDVLPEHPRAGLSAKRASRRSCAGWDNAGRELKSDPTMSGAMNLYDWGARAAGEPTLGRRQADDEVRDRWPQDLRDLWISGDREVTSPAEGEPVEYRC